MRSGRSVKITFQGYHTETTWFDTSKKGLLSHQKKRYRKREIEIVGKKRGVRQGVGKEPGRGVLYVGWENS